MPDFSLPGSIGSSLLSNIGIALPPAASSKPVDRKYKVMLEVKGFGKTKRGGPEDFVIIANLPEQFHMEFASQWRKPFEKYSAGELANTFRPGAGDIVNDAIGASGFVPKLKEQSYQIWDNGSPFQANLELLFYANESTEREVREKHVALLKLAAPSELISSAAGTVLRAPGPTIVGQTIDANSRRINLYIGEYLTVRNVIVTNVSSDIYCLFDNKGIPIGMAIGISVESFNSCFTADDIDDAFYGGGTSA